MDHREQDKTHRAVAPRQGDDRRLRHDDAHLDDLHGQMLAQDQLCRQLT
jgi:hypothetical protein